jgi:phage gpG-like protein
MKFNLRGDTNDLKKFRSKMLRLRNFGTRDFIKTAQDTAAIAVRYAQGRVPVLTGDLKRSIHAKKEGNAVFIGAEMDYAAVVEFGSKAKNRAPQPYFFNSIKDAMQQVEKDMNKKFKIIANT